MLVIIPTNLNSSNTTSTAPTSMDPAAWSISTPYVKGNRVSVYGTTNKIYELLATSLTGGSSPEIDVTKITPKWLEVGSTNKFAMFDGLRDTCTVTTTATSIVVTTTLVGTVNSVALLNMTNVSSVLFQQTSPGSTYSYSSVGENLLATYNTPFSIFTLTFTGTAPLSVGSFVIGEYVDIGRIQNGAEINALNFSSIDRDSYGSAYFIARKNVPKAQLKLYTDKSKVDRILRVKDDLNAVSTVWSGCDLNTTHPYYKALLFHGFYKEFLIDIDNPIGLTIDLELEEAGYSTYNV